MKLLFELNHPAHGHLFKNLIRQLKANGHEPTVLVKEIPVLKAILDDAGIAYTSIGKKGAGLASKFFRQLAFVWRTRRLQSQQNFRLGVGVSVTLPMLSRISSMAAIVLDDDDKKATPQFAFMAHRNAAAVLRPSALRHEGERANTIYYDGYHELAYLHPAMFKPDETVLKEQGIDKGEKFFIVRLVALKAHHDKGIHGISEEQAGRIIETLSPHGRIILTHEIGGRQLPGTEALHIHPARLHHLMAHARLIISDGQTMCSEAACLGVPSVRINDFAGRISYLQEQEDKWKLTFGFRPQQFESALQKISELLKSDPAEFKKRKDEMIASSIHLTNFLTWFIENWPGSLQVMKENPGFQEKFKGKAMRDER